MTGNLLCFMAEIRVFLPVEGISLPAEEKWGYKLAMDTETMHGLKHQFASCFHGDFTTNHWSVRPCLSNEHFPGAHPLSSTKPPLNVWKLQCQSTELQEWNMIASPLPPLINAWRYIGPGASQRGSKIGTPGGSGRSVHIFPPNQGEWSGQSCTQLIAVSCIITTITSNSWVLLPKWFAEWMRDSQPTYFLDGKQSWTTRPQTKSAVLTVISH